jgi:heat shock protein HtpX
MHAYGLYTHIRANRWRSLVLVGISILIVFITVFFALIVCGATIEILFPGAVSPSKTIIDANRFTLLKVAILAFVLAIMVATVSLLGEDFFLSSEGGGYPIRRSDNAELWNIVENLCISRGMKIPELRIMEVSALNAFSSGHDEHTYKITVTRGLINALDRKELECVIAHELTHIRNEDVYIMTFAAINFGLILGFSESITTFFKDIINDNNDALNQYASPIALVFIVSLFFLWPIFLVATFLSYLAKIALSQKRDYLADAGAVELTHNADAMVSALRKIDGKGDIPKAKSAFMELCIENTRQGIFSMNAQPPIS